MSATARTIPNQSKPVTPPGATATYISVVHGRNTNPRSGQTNVEGQIPSSGLSQTPNDYAETRAEQDHDRRQAAHLRVLSPGPRLCRRPTYTADMSVVGFRRWLLPNRWRSRPLDDPDRTSTMRRSEVHGCLGRGCAGGIVIGQREALPGTRTWSTAGSGRSGSRHGFLSAPNTLEERLGLVSCRVCRHQNPALQLMGDEFGRRHFGVTAPPARRCLSSRVGGHSHSTAMPDSSGASRMTRP